jgi:chorismate dehydratase
MNPGRYLLFPDLSITSKNRVMSILLESKFPIEELDKKVVALTTASATSVVLLRILLELRYKEHPRYVQYVQGVEDPLGSVDAMLTIGDLAIKRSLSSRYPYTYDLGGLWHEFTGYPFVFALWQVNDRKNNHNDLSRLYDIIIESRTYGVSHLKDLADTSAERFGLPSSVLYDYWNLFSYNFSEYEQKGLLAYYAYAAEIGAIKTVTDLRFWTKD